MQPELTVYYDGACPLCSAEVDAYRRADRSGRCQWVDASALPPQGPQQPSRDELLAALHVRDAQGRWWRGAAAFAQLWQRLPGWRWLGRLAAQPAAQAVLDPAYRAFLRVRPLWRSGR